MTVAGSRTHSLVAVGLRQAGRCPRSGAAQQECGGHGSCILGSCVCDAGWDGDGCTAQACDPMCNPLKGSCVVDQASGEPSCKCNVDANNKPLWTGTSCDDLHCDHFAGKICAGQGTCQIDASSGQHRCVCDAGWMGDDCATPTCSDPSLGATQPCSARGQCGCVPTGADPGVAGQPIRKCGGNPARKHVCTCDQGYSGSDCTATCAMDASGKVCGPHGTCVTVATDGIAATDSLSAVQASGAPPVASPSSTLTCQCDAGWGVGVGGALCDTPLCPGAPECGGETRGTCVRSPTGAACACSAGYTGADCSTLACPASCSGFGNCVIPADGSAPRCDCNFGRSGDDCSTNTGMISLVWSLSVGGGVLLCGILLGVCFYWLRASRSGKYVGPTESYRRRQWQAASSTRLGAGVAVHTPKRIPTKGSRRRVEPVFLAP